MKKGIFLFLTLVLLITTGYAGEPENIKLKSSPELVMGVLDNGLKYYILKNSKPEKRAELRLAVNAGSVLEDDDQQGLAHFVEHMGFNGTKNFPKQELINYLESIGMKFGPEVNAYTSFDETVYMLTIPTENKEAFEKGFTVLSDWAANMSFDPEEIDKERGVIIEEWRLGRGPFGRMQDKLFPVLFKDSKYSERLPIGKKDILENFKHESLISFYKEWYRPDLMSVIAVGDFDVDSVKQLIIKNFNEIKTSSGRKREDFLIPEFSETLVSAVSDKESPVTLVQIFNKRHYDYILTENNFRNSIISQIISNAVTDRLNEISQKPNPVISFPNSGSVTISRGKLFLITQAVTSESGQIPGVEQLVKEQKRIKLFGLTDSEIERQKVKIVNDLENQLNEKDRTESSVIVGEITSKALNNEPFIGIEAKYALTKTLISSISNDEINSRAKELFADQDRVVVTMGIEKDNLKLPSSEEIKTVISAIDETTIEPYSENALSKSLIEKEIASGKITEEKKIDGHNIFEIKLSNGSRVIVLPTDFKNDEIVFNCYAKGGQSVARDDSYIASLFTPYYLGNSGIGKFSSTDLTKMLSGKNVELSPWFNEYKQGMNGKSDKKSLETLMQMIHLYFTEFRTDTAAYDSFIQSMKVSLENAGRFPSQAFRDTINSVMAKGHFRAQPITAERLSEISLEKIREFYNSLFSEADDFTFFFTGSIDMNEFRPLLEKYIASLPFSEKVLGEKDNKISAPETVVKKEVVKGIDPQGRVALIFNGKLDWSSKELYNLQTLSDYLNIRLLEIIREEKSGTYGIYSFYSQEKFPESSYQFQIGFGCDPTRTDELTDLIFRQLDSLKNTPPAESYIQKLKEQQKKTREIQLKQNESLQGILFFLYENKLPLDEINGYDNWINELKAGDIQNAAKTYLNNNRYVLVTLKNEQK